MLRVDAVHDDVLAFAGNHAAAGVGRRARGDRASDFVLLLRVAMGDRGHRRGVGVERVVGGLFGYAGGVRDGLAKNVSRTRRGVGAQA